MESGLNGPMSVLLTVCLISKSWPRGSFMVAHAAILFYEETGGGALLLRWLPSAAHNNFAAPWLACMLLCRRFADVLADACARLGTDVGRNSFISVEFHHILLPGLLTHLLALRPARLLNRPRPPLSRRFDPAAHPARSLVSYQGLSTIACMEPSSTGDARPRGARVTVTVHTFDKLLSSDQPSIEALAKCRYR